MVRIAEDEENLLNALDGFSKVSILKKLDSTNGNTVVSKEITETLRSVEEKNSDIIWESQRRQCKECEWRAKNHLNKEIDELKALLEEKEQEITRLRELLK
jgi:hypothetical protein